MSTPHADPLDRRCHLVSVSRWYQRSGLHLTAQLHDLLQLRQENAYLATVTKQITPYIRSIARVKERLEPR